VSKANVELTDVNLICGGGSIPVHAAVMQSISPLFRLALESQVRIVENECIISFTILVDIPSLSSMNLCVTLTG
jgi:hypothetical protein